MLEAQELHRRLRDVVAMAVQTFKPRLLAVALSQERVVSHIAADDGHAHWLLDTELDNWYREQLRTRLPPFLLVSEEGKTEMVGKSGPEPELLVVLDPLDTSELAVRALSGYTQLLAWSFRERRPLAAVVGDFFHEICLYSAVAEPDGGTSAMLETRAGEVTSLDLRPTCGQPLSSALVTAFLMKPGHRFQSIAAQTRLLAALGEPDRGRIGVDFGSIGLCHVAAGLTDAMIEIARGFTWWDLLPGRFILESAGGRFHALTDDGSSWDLASVGESPQDVTDRARRRIRFVAAGDDTLLSEILDLLSL